MNYSFHSFLSLANATGTWSALLNGTVMIIQGSVIALLYFTLLTYYFTFIAGFKPTNFQLPAQLFKPEYKNNTDLQ